MTKQLWRGVWTALVTPLKKSKSGLRIDSESLKKLIDRQYDEGANGLVIAGSTGEGSLLSSQNYESLLEIAVDLVKGRLPLVAGLGIGGTESCQANVLLAKKYKYQGVLASPPAYVRAPQDALAEHFLTLASYGIPVCMYEIAARSASSISLSTLEKLAVTRDSRAKNLVAIKDASGDLRRFLDEKRICEDRFSLLSGDDGTFAAFVLAGGDGVISVATHTHLKSFRSIYENALAGKKIEAVTEQSRIAPYIDALFMESNPIPVKSLLETLGWISRTEFSPPLRSMEPDKLKGLMKLYRGTL